MTNVYDYFTDKLQQTPDDETLMELALDTVCGQKCQQAIDAAAAFVAVCSEANPCVCDAVYPVINSTVETFWRG